MVRKNHIERVFDLHNPRKIPGRKFFVRSCTTAIMTNEDPSEASILLIRRAERLGDPWSGHMAFPGGRLDKSDAHAFAGAMRELKEEIGVDGSQGLTHVGRLSDLITKAHEKLVPMIVTPFVFLADRKLEVTLNNEVQEVVWIPLNFLTNPENRKQMDFRFMSKTWKLPCYDYEGRHIWGLTLLMLDELIALISGTMTGGSGWMPRLRHPIR